MIKDNPQQADLAYAAGYFDGEGSFYLRYTPSQKCWKATIMSSDPKTLQWFYELFGGSFRQNNNNQSSWIKKQMYSWELSGHGTYAFVLAVLPYLKYKREHAMHCLKAWESRSDTEAFIEACEERKRRWGRAAAETK